MSDQSSEQKQPPVDLFGSKNWVDASKETMDQFLAAADVEAVYGEPVEHGNQLIIPTAEIISGIGFGYGGGGGYDSTSASEKGPNYGGGNGGGGGGKILSRPVAVIIASPQGVRVEPVVDVTKVALAALTAWGFMIGMYFRMRGGRHMMHEMRELRKQQS